MNIIIIGLIIVLLILFINQKRKHEESINNLADKLERAQEESNRKIKELSDALLNLKIENTKLRKDLEYFTQIEADSKRLNETEDSKQQDDLIKQVIKEVSNDNDILPVADSNEISQSHINNTYSVSEYAGNPSILDDEQKKAFDRMMNAADNLLITGKAGTGKSFLLRLFAKANREKKLLLLAPTGISAINIGAATIHSAFGFNNLTTQEIERLSSGEIRLESSKKAVLKESDTIVFDEVSMIRADVFEKIDVILKNICKSDRPFGGKQIVLFGDLFQLPPIAKPDERRYLENKFGGIYFFNSNAYKEGGFSFIELTINHRQSEDVPFFNILNRIREGAVSESELTALNDRTNFNQDELRRIIRLFPKKDAAEEVNRQELEKIPAREFCFKASVDFTDGDNTQQIKEGSFPVPLELRLKIGALVMMASNDLDKRWVNGTLGIVSRIRDDYIEVEINGYKQQVHKNHFEQLEAEYIDGKIQYKTVCTIEQYPMVLAYAITIHKSQGMTYQRVACDVTAAFSPGQAYVALSRCSSLSGLYLLNKVTMASLKVDERVREFYLKQINT